MTTTHFINEDSHAHQNKALQMKKRNSASILVGENDSVMYVVSNTQNEYSEWKGAWAKGKENGEDGHDEGWEEEEWDEDDWDEEDEEWEESEEDWLEGIPGWEGDDDWE